MGKRSVFYLVGLFLLVPPLFVCVNSAPQDAATLKSYFEPRDRPTSSNFQDLIDSFLLVNGDNWPATLPASNGSNLTNLTLPDPLPVLDGRNLTNITANEWQALIVGISCNYVSANSINVSPGDFTTTFASDQRLKLNFSDAPDLVTDSTGASYNAGSDLTVVNLADNMPTVNLTGCEHGVFTPGGNGAISLASIGGVAANIPFTPAQGLTSTDVQAAIEEVVNSGSGDLGTHVADTSTHGIASTIAGLSETQTFINKTIVAANNTLTTAASGNLISTELNAALAELQGDIDTRATSTELTNVNTTLTNNLNAHTGASSGVHGLSGAVVGTSDAATLTLKTIVVANNTITTAASGNLTNTELNAALAELQSDIDSRAKSIGVLVYKSGDQAIPNSTTTPILFDLESYDDNAMHSTVSNTDRLVVPSGVSKVRLTAQALFYENSTGYRTAHIRKNGAYFDFSPAEIEMNPTATERPNFNLVTPVISAIPGDYFTVNVWQTSGASLNLRGSESWFGMEIIE